MQEVKQYTAVLNGVEVIYPRLDQPYNWSNEKNSSAPCEWNAENAAFTVSLVVPYEKALPLRKAMLEAYEAKKEGGWPKFKDNFKLIEGTLADKDAIFHVRTKLRCYDKDTAVRQFDADNNRLSSDFRLTRGSVVNAMVTLVPYNLNGSGASLRLNALQVTKLAPTQQSASPFDKVEGYTVEDASPFQEPVAASEKLSDDEDTEWEEEPKKTASKKKATPEVKNDIDDDDLDSIIDDWAQ